MGRVERVEDGSACPFSEEDSQKGHGHISFVKTPVPLGVRLYKSLTLRLSLDNKLAWL
jgi:hypothetical protein